MNVCNPSGSKIQMNTTLYHRKLLKMQLNRSIKKQSNMATVEKVKINTQLKITNLLECKMQLNKIQEITTNDN